MPDGAGSRGSEADDAGPMVHLARQLVGQISAQDKRVLGAGKTENAYDQKSVRQDAIPLSRRSSRD